MTRGSAGLQGARTSQEAGVPKGIGLKEAAQTAGVSVSTVRHYLSKGWLTPDRVPIPGGYRYSFRQRDIDRLQETVSHNLDWMAKRRPGLLRYFEAKALEQGRRLPYATGRRL